MTGGFAPFGGPPGSRRPVARPRVVTGTTPTQPESVWVVTEYQASVRADRIIGVFASEDAALKFASGIRGSTVVDEWEVTP